MSIKEAKDLMKRQQKLVQLADASELGWRVVAEYETNPITSDSADERRIYKAEGRARRKGKADKTRFLQVPAEEAILRYSCKKNEILAFKIEDLREFSHQNPKQLMEAVITVYEILWCFQGSSPFLVCVAANRCHYFKQLI